ncbi:cytochrome P450 4d1-like [Drosophila miranda]|uniref:cytochrome P450 4d1-like n=1 Tax=Drosophila miranda TaxID=7229 RepID=UPI0007E71292|nr:cytochrome P450 4d1-like [Drosophila miranda]
MINGKRIPAGTNIGISPLYLGRREELFSEPNSFNPERFNVVTSAEKLNPYAYIPFSAGPRNCIGQSLPCSRLRPTSCVTTTSTLSVTQRSRLWSLLN